MTLSSRHLQDRVCYQVSGHRSCVGYDYATVQYTSTKVEKPDEKKTRRGEHVQRAMEEIVDRHQ